MMKEKQSLGTPSEIAMLKYVEQIIDVRITRLNHKIVFEIPFNSKRKWHLIIVKGRDLKDGTNKYKLIMKGASEILIQKCSKILTSTGELIDLDEAAMAKFQNSYDHFGEHGRRVIGFVEHEFIAPSNIEFTEKAGNFAQEGLTFIGTCAIMDPPRDETAGSIKKCKEAGIKVFMVTGDHHTTAKAIAKQIGLIEDIPGKEKDWDVVHGENISKITDAEWDRLISLNNLVFSRTTPEQKLQIVEQCQKRKQIIAMTGDGVNDAPALKKSDIGVGMGSGSDVAKQAADIILTDDNFSSIVKAIQEGRLMFDNIKKLMAYILTHTFPEIWAVMLNFCFGMPIATSSLMILSIDLGTEIPPGIAMCKEPMEGDLMKRPPRRRDKVVVSWTLLLYSYLYTAHVQVLACFLSYCRQLSPCSANWHYLESLSMYHISMNFLVVHRCQPDVGGSSPPLASLSSVIMS
uniref:Cation-transporting P-type ATPase C-terminal domain-containing protein n=1 Tax=Acrobeloides nanus TaxID=290746 RepID=A0A914BV70_9BILA